MIQTDFTRWAGQVCLRGILGRCSQLPAAPEHRGVDPQSSLGGSVPPPRPAPLQEALWAGSQTNPSPPGSLPWSEETSVPPHPDTRGGRFLPPPHSFSGHLAESHLLPLDFQPSTHQSQGTHVKLSRGLGGEGKTPPLPLGRKGAGIDSSTWPQRNSPYKYFFKILLPDTFIPMTWMTEVHWLLAPGLKCPFIIR